METEIPVDSWRLHKRFTITIVGILGLIYLASVIAFKDMPSEKSTQMVQITQHLFFLVLGYLGGQSATDGWGKKSATTEGVPDVPPIQSSIPPPPSDNPNPDQDRSLEDRAG